MPTRKSSTRKTKARGTVSAKPVARRPVGRPTKYDPRYCDELLKVMGTGLSLTAFAGTIGVSRDTITEWMNQHPEFSAAAQAGQAMRTAYLERTMLDGEVSGPQVTARVFALKNAAPLEWRDKHEVEHKGDGFAITVNLA